MVRASASQAEYVSSILVTCFIVIVNLYKEEYFMGKIKIDCNWLPDDYHQLDRFYQQHYDKLMRVFEDMLINDISPLRYRYVIEEATMLLGRNRVDKVAKHYRISPKRLDCVFSTTYSNIGTY